MYVYNIVEFVDIHTSLSLLLCICMNYDIACKTGVVVSMTMSCVSDMCVCVHMCV